MKKSLLLLIAICFLPALTPPCPAADAPRLTTVTEERYRLQPGDVSSAVPLFHPNSNQTVTSPA